MNKKVQAIIDYVISNGEITKEEVISAFGVSAEEYSDIRKEVLRHRRSKNLIVAGPRHTGGFVVRRGRQGIPKESTGSAPVFATEWEQKTVNRLCELLQHREVEDLLGPIAQTVRQSRFHRRNVDRRGTKRELASALVIQHGIDLLKDVATRRLVGKRTRVETPDNWHPGKGRATQFVAATGFPPELAGIPTEDSLPDYEYLEGRIELRELADFQMEVQEQLSETLRTPGRPALVTLPTGAGKTRVAVETLRDWFTRNFNPMAGSNSRAVLWLAHTEELCEQAYACFQQVWQNATVVSPLMLFRFWGEYTRRYEQHQETLDRIKVEPTLLVSTPHRIVSLLNAEGSGERQVLETLRLAVDVVVIDEAHRAAAPSYRQIVNEFVSNGKQMSLIGLTATPFRLEYLGNDPEAGTQELYDLFKNLIEATKTLGEDPREKLQEREILARPVVQMIPTHTNLELPAFPDGAELTPEDMERVDSALKIRADNAKRRMAIFEHILPICKAPDNLMLYFGPSVRDAECMAYLLREEGVPAAVVSADTRDVTRRRIVKDFKEGRIKVLCNCEVLTTGFDAPKVTHVVVARPTVSQVLYEQIIGRGLRGPKFGGTALCTILDCEDGIQQRGSGTLKLGYQAFRHIWKPTVVKSAD